MLDGYFSEEITTNDRGGSQSRTRAAFHLIPSIVLFKLGETLNMGEKKYGRNNWQKISVEDHLNHAIQHIYGFLGGDSTEDHLTHALARLCFSLAMSCSENKKPPSSVDELLQTTKEIKNAINQAGHEQSKPTKFEGDSSSPDPWGSGRVRFDEVFNEFDPYQIPLAKKS